METAARIEHAREQERMCRVLWYGRLGWDHRDCVAGISGTRGRDKRPDHADHSQSGSTMPLAKTFVYSLRLVLAPS
jgi:hypothetical protein